MKLCEKCKSENPDDAKFCRQCGRAFAAPVAVPPDATVRWVGQKLSARQLVSGAVPVASLFGNKDRLVIGRAEDCDVCLPHPMVSRYHALAVRQPDGVHLRDLASINGLWLNGKRVKEPIRLHDGDRVGIGPFLFTLKQGEVHSIDNSLGLRLEARHLEKVVPVACGTRKLLDDINLVVNPGEFVTILGPSGCGKSTLMDCLNGRRRATGGKVLANGEDFYRHFNNFRQSLGYVPQKDIVHGGLTVFKALLYTAKLRLPTDTSAEELRERVETVIGEMQLGPHRDTQIERLSGGQIKRVSLGAELLARPSLLYIDEATSGLDAGTEAKMMRLFRRLSDEGRSIICITHALENVDQCHLILLLAKGKMIYYGPPSEAPRYFKVPRISEVYDQIGQRPVEEWEKEFRDSQYYRELVLERLAVPLGAQTPTDPGTPTPATPGAAGVATPTLIKRQAGEAAGAKGKPLADRIRQYTSAALDWQSWWRPIRDGFRQFGVLTARYLELIWSDKRSLLLQILQAPIVALVILLAFHDKDYQGTIPVPREFNEKEKKVLNALVELSQTSGARPGGKLSPEMEKRLHAAKIQTEVKNPITKEVQKVEVTALQLLLLAEAADQAGAGSEAREALNHLMLSVGPGNKTVTLSKGELEAILKETHESGLLKRLSDLKGPIVPFKEMVNPRYSYMLLFIVVVVVMWFGCNNAAKEIVKEEPIYSRERAVNLGIFPYLASKFIVQVALTILQVILLLVCIFGVMSALSAAWPEQFSMPPTQPMFGTSEPENPPYMLNYPSLFLILMLLGLGGVALGLALSAVVPTPDSANSLLPYVMIPQLIFGGGIMAVGTGLLYLLSGTFSSVYWAFRGAHLNANLLPEKFPGWVPYTDTFWLPCEALLLQTAILLLLTVVFLKRKDV
jgi:ABC-type multidrug transport system ATPase subunit